MVQTYRRDDHDRRVDDVGGIPASAHTDLDDRNVNRCVGERGERHRGDDLELTHRRADLPELTGLRLGIHQVNERLDFTIGFDIARRADRLIIDGDALNRRLQVWAGGTSGPAVQRGQQGVDHSSH